MGAGELKQTQQLVVGNMTEKMKAIKIKLRAQQCKHLAPVAIGMGRWLAVSGRGISHQHHLQGRETPHQDREGSHEGAKATKRLQCSAHEGDHGITLGENETRPDLQPTLRVGDDLLKINPLMDHMKAAAQMGREGVQLERGGKNSGICISNCRQIHQIPPTPTGTQGEGRGTEV